MIRLVDLEYTVSECDPCQRSPASWPHCYILQYDTYRGSFGELTVNHNSRSNYAKQLTEELMQNTITNQNHVFLWDNND
jgi:hypothetical protein